MRLQMVVNPRSVSGNRPEGGNKHFEGFPIACRMASFSMLWSVTEIQLTFSREELCSVSIIPAVVWADLIGL